MSAMSVATRDARLRDAGTAEAWRGDAGGELVTVVIPARDEEGFIGPCLDSVLAQDESNLQVIVVDGASRDRTSEVVRCYMRRDPRIELLDNPAGRIPTALNLALAAARGRWLVRVDAHSTIPPAYVSSLVRHLRTGRWGGVGSRKDGIGATPAGRAIASAMASPFGVGGSRYHYGTRVQPVDHVPFGAYPTGLVRRIGGWDERLAANEDFELDYRIRKAGRSLLLDPSVAIAWRCRQSFGDFFRQYLRYGRAKARVARLHPASLRPRHLASPALVGSWAAAPALSVRWPWFPALVLLPYAVALTAASLAAARKASHRASPQLIAAAFLTMHAGWGMGFWQGLGDMLRDALRRIRRG
jgi:succinoglycan biosynthesis protein ExoA